MNQEFILPAILLVPAAIQVLYYLFVFSRFSFSRAKSKNKQHLVPISVIVCGRNEEENFKAFLPSILKQNYPNFEVVAVNDQSIDNTKDVLEELQLHYKNLRVVNVEENERFWNGKKYGLTLGIKAAMHDNLLFIDADCKPNSSEWISEMAAGFGNDDKQIVLGFGAYNKEKGLLNKIIRFETLQSAIQYFSWALWGMPYMGVGRNLAYTRPLFYEQRGFVPHMHIPMGDDDLFVNAAGTRKNTAVVYTKESFTYSTPKSHYKDWFIQKRRHIATSSNYKGLHKSLLGLFGATQVLFLISTIVSIVLYSVLPVWIWYGVAARYVFLYLTFIFSVKKTNDWDLLVLLPFLEIFLVLNQVLIILANRFNKNYKWK